MCGRIAQTTTIERMIELTDIANRLDHVPEFNLSPTMDVAGIWRDEQGRRLWAKYRWGLIPAWAKDRAIAYKTFNAKSETVAQKPAFRSAYRKRHCILPVDGFYEWLRAGREKLPYFIHLHSGQPLLLAGLWESWQEDSASEPVLSCTILTTQANALLSQIHDRMPVIIPPEKIDAWLITGAETVANELLASYAGNDLEMHRVTTKMNSGRYREPDCMTALTD